MPQKPPTKRAVRDSDNRPEKPPTPSQRIARLHDAEWLRNQIRELAKDAEAEAEEYRREASEIRDIERKAAHNARAALSEHFGKQMRSVLEGWTPKEALINRLRKAIK